jgi:hypothetical protein
MEQSFSSSASGPASCRGDELCGGGRSIGRLATRRLPTSRYNKHENVRVSVFVKRSVLPQELGHEDSW